MDYIRYNKSVNLYLSLWGRGIHFLGILFPFTNFVLSWGFPPNPYFVGTGIQGESSMSDRNPYVHGGLWIGLRR